MKNTWGFSLLLVFGNAVAAPIIYPKESPKHWPDEQFEISLNSASLVSNALELNFWVTRKVKNPKDGVTKIDSHIVATCSPNSVLDTGDIFYVGDKVVRIEENASFVAVDSESSLENLIRNLCVG